MVLIERRVDMAGTAKFVLTGRGWDVMPEREKSRLTGDENLILQGSGDVGKWKISGSFQGSLPDREHFLPGTVVAGLFAQP